MGDGQANIMSRDRFNGCPLEDAVRHNFDMRNADQVQKLLRDHGATLAGEGLDYVRVPAAGHAFASSVSATARARWRRWWWWRHCSFVCTLLCDLERETAGTGTNRLHEAYGMLELCAQVVKMCSYAAEGQVHFQDCTRCISIQNLNQPP